jgi:hypothetical protein
MRCREKRFRIVAAKSPSIALDSYERRETWTTFLNPSQTGREHHRAIMTDSAPVCLIDMNQALKSAPGVWRS